MYERFEELIKEKGLKPYKVSADTGISQSTLSDWKKGKHVPRIDKLIILANYLNVDLDYLTGNSNIRKKVPITNLNNVDITKKTIPTIAEERDNEVKEAFSVLMSALKIQDPVSTLTDREKKLLFSFSLLSDDMQDSFLAMLESTVKNIQQNS